MLMFILFWESQPTCANSWKRIVVGHDTAGEGHQVLGIENELCHKILVRVVEIKRNANIPSKIVRIQEREHDDKGN